MIKIMIPHHDGRSRHSFYGFPSKPKVCMALLSDQKIAVLTADGVNQNELGILRESMEKHGITIDIVAEKLPEVKAWTANDWGNRIKVDRLLKDVSAEDYSGIIIPGGAFHADELRGKARALEVIRQAFAAGKPVGAMGHGTQLLISAGIVRGMNVTGSPSLKGDVGYAGGTWAADGVIADNGLVTGKGEDEADRFAQAFEDHLRAGLVQRAPTII
jgi:protease I